MVKIATHELVVAQKTQVILVTPPPVDERLCLATDKAKGIDVMRRTAKNTARYAEAVRAVGKQLGLPVLDMWSAFMKEAGWKEGEVLPGSSEIPQNPVFVRLMHDGELYCRYEFVAKVLNCDLRASPKPRGLQDHVQRVDAAHRERDPGAYPGETAIRIPIMGRR